MKIDPRYISFGDLFRSNDVFYTPEYQRDYSWDEEQIEQFCSDIREALLKKHHGEPCEHFFGGVVCAQESRIGNTSKRNENLLVDGQQRLSTTILFFAVINNILKKIECNEDDDNYRNEILKDIQKYFYFDEREHREVKPYRRIKIGAADNDFYESLIENAPIKHNRNSHKLMLSAKKCFENFFLEELFNEKSSSECLDVVDNVVKLFNESFTLIHIVTSSVDEAYKLFTVLNDRGINLTEGELLKAYTIGICKENKSHIRQISSDWDLILKYPSKKVTDYLRWIIIMVLGENVTASSVLQNYKLKYFKDSCSSNEIFEKVRFLRNCVERLEYISEGAWPYDDSMSSSNWHKAKLDVLVNKLQHAYAMPMLLAASFSSENNFQDLVNETCKFFLRYKAISNLHASVFSTLYPALAHKILSLRDRFNISLLHTEFNKIIVQRDGDGQHFINGINSLKYQKKGDNKPIKCLLITIQENWQWLMDSNHSSPANRLRREDRSVVFEFNNTTLEHISPYSSTSNSDNSDVDKLKNSIGNLVILDVNRNSKNDNKSFSAKKEFFKNTGIGIHEKLLSYDEWQESSIHDLQSKYIDYSLKVFSFGGK